MLENKRSSHASIYYNIAELTREEKRLNFLIAEQDSNNTVYAELLSEQVRLDAHWEKVAHGKYVLVLDNLKVKIARITLADSFRNGHKTQIKKHIGLFSYWKTIASNNSPYWARSCFDNFMADENLKR